MTSMLYLNALCSSVYNIQIEKYSFYFFYTYNTVLYLHCFYLQNVQIRCKPIELPRACQIYPIKWFIVIQNRNRSNFMIIQKDTTAIKMYSVERFLDMSKD